MKLKVFSIRDSKGNCFRDPFQSHNERDAVFNFKKLVNVKNSLPGQYPKDFDLYLLGEFDDQTGKYSTLDKPQHIEEAIKLLDQKTDETVLQHPGLAQ